jgi:hypothetical protein
MLASSSMSAQAAALGSSPKPVIVVCFVPMAPCRAPRSRQGVPAKVMRLLAALNNRSICRFMNTTTVVIRTAAEEPTYRYLRLNGYPQSDRYLNLMDGDHEPEATTNLV